MEDIATKDFVLNIKDKLTDLTSFIETDTYIPDYDDCFRELDEIAYHIYEAQSMLDSFIEKYYPKGISGTTQE